MTTLAADPIDVAHPQRPGARRALSVVRRVSSIVGTLALVAGALLLVAMTIGPRVLHYRTATMLTGSMVPTIRPGDVIVDVEQDASDIRVGQIITYQIPIDDHRVESHRVVWVGRAADGGVLFRTKGDANAGADPWTADAGSQKVWRVATAVPVAGDVIRFLRRPLVNLALARGLPLILVLSVLVAIWRPRRSTQE